MSCFVRTATLNNEYITLVLLLSLPSLFRNLVWFIRSVTSEHSHLQILRSIITAKGRLSQISGSWNGINLMIRHEGSVCLLLNS